MRASARRYTLTAVGLSLLVLTSFISTFTVQDAKPLDEGTGHVLPRMGGPLQAANSSSPNYDEQIGLTFTDTFTSLQYNVTAVAQTDSDGYGPAYLLNGLTDMGYWYQVGLSWDWNPGTVPGTGFSMSYEVFDSDGNSIFPTTGQGGLLSYSGGVNSGDTVELSLSFLSGTVLMYSSDLNTGANASITYSAEGASEFVGLLTPSNQNGFFTGLMTEEYHSSAYLGNVLGVNYSATTPLGNGFLWADEFTVAPRSTIFFGSKFVSFLNPGQVQSFAKNGTTEYADAHFLVTGTLHEIPLTLSYSVVGGGSRYSGPTLAYMRNGTMVSANLTSTPTTFFVDPGTAWSVTALLPGSGSVERWEAAGTPGGVANGETTEDITFYHQFLVSLGYSITGGGYGVPQVQYVAFGTSTTGSGNKSNWTDAGSSLLYPSLLSDSTTSERWITLNRTVTVTGPNGILVEYYHQYALAVDYAVVGGGAPSAPTLSGIQFGSHIGATLSNGTSYFLDTESAWSVPTLLQGSGPNERWIDLAPVNGTLLGPTTLALQYFHQFTVSAVVSPSDGGGVGNFSAWQDAGSTIVLSQRANSGWRFEQWNGTGIGSYSGGTASASVLVNSPIAEEATFYPGLQISAGNDGSVSYVLGSVTGSVPEGTSTTVFGPIGAIVRLQASPSLFFYSFSGWSPGTNGSSSQTTISLSGPGKVTAVFSLDIPVLGAIIAVALVVAAAAVYAFTRSRHKATDIKTLPPS